MFVMKSKYYMGYHPLRTDHIHADPHPCKHYTIPMARNAALSVHAGGEIHAIFLRVTMPCHIGTRFNSDSIATEFTPAQCRNRIPVYKLHQQKLIPTKSIITQSPKFSADSLIGNTACSAV